MKFSQHELFDLSKAWILISIAFAILFKDSFNKNYFLVFLVVLLSAGLGFLLHELAHKYIAQKYGFFAEFQAFDTMLIVAIIFSFFGFIFAAPGAVIIHGNINKRKNGIISLSGPLTNIILAIIFFMLAGFNIFSFVSNFGFKINSYLALFNMLPFFGLDGQKVFQWNKIIYIILILISFMLVFMQYI